MRYDPRLLRELAVCFAQTAVDSLLAQSASAETKHRKGRRTGGALRAKKARAAKKR